MKRLWLKIPGFRVYGIQKPGEGSEEAWMNIRLGDALSVNGVHVTSSKGGYPPRIYAQNWAMAQVRFLDVPLFHKKHPKRAPLLEDVLGLAFVESWGELARVLRNGAEQTELEFMRPRAWRGKSLRIPVDFVRLFDFRCPHGGWPIYAHVRCGHHFVVWEVNIYDRGKFALDSDGKKGILDPKLHRAVDLIFRRPDFRAYVERISESSMSSRGQEFIVKAKGCDPEATPPAIRFY